MTNDAMSTILEYFFQEARGSAEAILRASELLRGSGAGAPADEAEIARLAPGTASADRLLRSIADVRSLLSRDTPVGTPAVTMDKFDLARGAIEIVEALNMASGRCVRQMVVDGPPEPLLLTQDRRAVEELLTRVLDTAGKLAAAGEIHLRLKIVAGGTCARAAISVGEADLAVRLANWLNADPDRVQFNHAGDVPFAVALMSAGRRLRRLGGAAELTHDASGFSVICLDVPLHAPGAGDPGAQDPGPAARPDSLDVLVAEDNDESFALTEVELRDERIWRALDGPQALRMVQTQRFDVVFMDVHMPGMDGYQVIRSMREWETQTGYARTPLVVLSSDDPETQRRFAAECGCSGFLSKPLRRWDVLPLLDRLKQTRMPRD